MTIDYSRNASRSVTTNGRRNSKRFWLNVSASRNAYVELKALGVSPIAWGFFVTS